MRQSMLSNKIKVSLGLVLAGLFSFFSGCATEDTQALYLFERGDAVRGGALYDKWWVVPGVLEGIEPGEADSSLPVDNPQYATHTGTSTRTGSQTWRCKECHGWDYKGKDGVYGTGSHSTGFRGLLGTATSVTDLQRFLRDGGGDGNHVFARVLSDTDRADLVKFILEGTIDSAVHTKSDKTSTGDSALGKPLFDANCSTCHGTDGKKINFKKGQTLSEFVSDIAYANPWEFVHKVRFGQPDGQMPTGHAAGYSLKDVANILAYARSLQVPGLEGASVVRGGALYDKWWAVNGAAKPTTTNGVYKDIAYNKEYHAPTDNAKDGVGDKAGNATWRCKECHGWDYKGIDGAYKSGSHRTQIKGVFGSSSLEVADLIAVIGDGILPGKTTPTTLADHAFKGLGLLSDGDVKDLALFITEGLGSQPELANPDTFLNASKRSLGSVSVGKANFNSNCSTCHGKDGMQMNFKGGDAAPGAEYIGDLSRDNPWEFVHKVRFGHPGSDDHAEGHMPNMLDAGYSNADVSGILAYAQTLRGSVERGGLAWDKWWKTPGVANPFEPAATGSILTNATNSYYKNNAVKTPAYIPADAQKPKVLNSRSGSQTYRCKECHGWDYKGKDGAYKQDAYTAGTTITAGSSHATGFAGILGTTKTSTELYEAINTGVVMGTASLDWHAFGAVLGEDVMRDLVNFMMQITDVDVPINDGGTETLGKFKYDATCSSCHGLDGTTINFKTVTSPEYIGTLANDNKWEFLHKASYGQPGSDPMMPNAVGENYAIADLVDILTYAKTLQQ